MGKVATELIFTKVVTNSLNNQIISSVKNIILGNSYASATKWA